MRVGMSVDTFCICLVRKLCRYVRMSVLRGFSHAFSAEILLLCRVVLGQSIELLVSRVCRVRAIYRHKYVLALLSSFHVYRMAFAAA